MVQEDIEDDIYSLTKPQAEDFEDRVMNSRELKRIQRPFKERVKNIIENLKRENQDNYRFNTICQSIQKVPEESFDNEEKFFYEDLPSKSKVRFEDNMRLERLQSSKQKSVGFNIDLENNEDFTLNEDH